VEWHGSLVIVGATNVSTTTTTATAIQADWNTQANSYRGKNGQQFTFFFPAGGTLSTRLWGTDIYTDDGSIATAAVHAGAITTTSGGTVTIEIRPGQDGYKGSTRNGVTSYDYGQWQGSFVIVKSSATLPVIQGSWTTQADTYRGKIGQRFTFVFPPNGTLSDRLWGTDVYTDDGSIATAAVHAGLITKQSGGTVTIEIRAGQPTYRGSTRNGVTSKDYGAWGGSFVFAR